MPLSRPISLFSSHIHSLSKPSRLRFTNLNPPPRSLPTHICHFHSSIPARNPPEEATYYDILELPRSASAADIKRRFYELSKAHHPDHNPKDPNASSRFIKITNAYSVIGNAQKRAKYDKELSHRYGIRHDHHSAGGGGGSGPAGGRPASGLSRRRTQFHGPPSSFYKHGGYGRHTSRAADAAEATQRASAKGPVGGMGYTGASSGRNDDVPHFNFDKHRMQQERRRKRAANAEDYGFIAPGMVLPLVGVGTLLVFAYTVASQDDRNKSRGPRA